jgi:hypothetical protein
MLSETVNRASLIYTHRLMISSAQHLQGCPEIHCVPECEEIRILVVEKGVPHGTWVSGKPMLGGDGWLWPR